MTHEYWTLTYLCLIFVVESEAFANEKENLFFAMSKNVSREMDGDVAENEGSQSTTEPEESKSVD